MKCRIVSAVCQHNYAQVQRVSSFPTQKTSFFFLEKNEKIVTLSNFFVQTYPCFYLILNKIPLNKAKKRLGRLTADTKPSSFPALFLSLFILEVKSAWNEVGTKRGELACDDVHDYFWFSLACDCMGKWRESF